MEPIKNVFSLKPNKRDIIEGFILGIRIFHQFFFQKISVVVPFALIKAFLVQTCFFSLLLISFIVLFTACFFCTALHTGIMIVLDLIMRMVGTRLQN